MSETIQPGTTPPADRRRRRAVIAASAAAIAVLVAVLLLGGGDDGPDPTGAAPTASSTAGTRSPSPTPSPSGSTTEPTPTPDPSGSPTPAPEPAPAEGAPTPAPQSLATLPPLTAEPPTVVPLDAPAAEVGPSVTARLVAIEDVTSTGTGIGEFSGPAYLVTVELTGGGAAAVDLSTVAVAAYLGEQGTPASPVFTDERNVPLTGTLAPGASARGSYVFAAPPEERGLLSVTVLVGLDPQMVVFQGDPANRPG